MEAQRAWRRERRRWRLRKRTWGSGSPTGRGGVCWLGGKASRSSSGQKKRTWRTPHSPAEKQMNYHLGLSHCSICNQYHTLKILYILSRVPSVVVSTLGETTGIFQTGTLINSACFCGQVTHPASSIGPDGPAQTWHMPQPGSVATNQNSKTPAFYFRQGSSG